MTERIKGEWVAGTLSIDGVEAFFLLTLDGELLVTGPFYEGADLADAVRQAISEPMMGKPGRPTRLRIGRPDLADAFERAVGAEIPVVRAPAPEAESFAAEYVIHEESGGKSTLLINGVGAERIAAFHRATARLVRVDPWAVVRKSRVMGITVEALGVRNGAIAFTHGVKGKDHEDDVTGCLLFFDGWDEHLEWVRTGKARMVDKSLPIQPYVHLRFERGRGIEPDIRKEIAMRRWEVAHARAFPELLRFTADVSALRARDSDYALATAACLALAELTERDARLETAWRWGKGIVHEARIDDVVVVLEAPHPRAQHPATREPFDVRARVCGADGRLDPTWFEVYCDEILDGFVETDAGERFGPHAQKALDVLCQLVEHYDVTVADMTPAQLEDALFVRLPATAALAPDAAPAILAEMRSLCDYLAGELGLENARACRKVLMGAERKLRHTLAMARPKPENDTRPRR